MFSKPIKVITMWGPFLGITAWGGFHLFDCAQTLFSPGIGFAVEYPTPGGNLKVRCSTYAFDPVTGVLLGNDVEIRHPDGKLIARVPKLRLQGLYFDGSIAPRTIVQSGTVWVRRQKNGQLDIAKYLESKPQEPSDVAFAVELKNCKVNFIDEATPGVPTDQLEIPEAYIAGKGNATHGYVVGNVNDWLKGRFEIRRFGDRIEVVGRKLDVLPAPLISRLRKGPEAKLLKIIDPLSVNSGRLQGNATINLGIKTAWDVDATGTLEGLKWDKYSAAKSTLKLRLNENGFNGRIDAENKGLVASFEGSANYGKALSLAGNITAKGITQSVLSDYGLPKIQQVSFDSGSGSGWLTYKDNRLGFTGNLVAKSVSAYKLKTPTLDAKVNWQDNKISAIWKPLQIGRTTVAGQFGYDLAKGQWQVFAESNNAQSNDFAPWAPAELRGTTGRLQLFANGDGKRVSVKSAGLLDPKIQIGNSSLTYDDAEFALSYDGLQVKIERFRIQDKNTTLLAAGTYHLKKGLNLSITGTGIDLNTLYASARGRADVKGILTGTIENPKYSGDFNGYEIGYGDVPGKLSAVAGELSANRKGVSIKNLLAVRGAAQLGGNLQYDFEKEKLGGLFSVKGLDIKELYAGPVTGLLDIEDIKVEGTASKPVITAQVSTRSILAKDFKIEDIKGGLRYENDLFTINGATANVAGGTLEGVQLQLNPTTKSGQLKGEFKQLKVEELTDRLRESTLKTEEQDEAVLGRDIVAKGGLGGSFTVDILKGAVSKVTSAGRLEDIRLNKAYFGSGDWSLGLTDDKWNFDAMLGSLDDYIRVDAATYNTKNGRIGGELIAYNLPIKELLLAAEPQLATSPDTFEKLKLVSGKFGVLAKLSGELENPVVEVPDLLVNELKIAKEDLGTLKVKATYSNKDLIVSEGSLTGPKVTSITIPFGGKIQLPERFSVPDGTVKLDGRILNGGAIDFKATMFGFPVSKFTPLFPQFESIDAFVSKAELKATGTVAEPVVSADLIGSVGFDAGNEKGAASYLKERLKINGHLEAKPRPDFLDLNLRSALKFSSLVGYANGSISLTKDFQLAKKEPLNFTVGLDGERSLNTFLKDAEGLDLGTKDAVAKGSITASNTWDALKLDGAIEINAEQLKYTKPSKVLGGTVNTWLQNLSSKLTVENDPKHGYILKSTGRATTNYSTKSEASSDQGYAIWSAGISIQDFVSMSPSKKNFTDREIINGTFSVNKIAVGQTFPENTFASFTAFTDKPLSIQGSMFKPILKGELQFEKIKTALPTLEIESGSGAGSLFDPKFDLTFKIADSAEIKTGTADMRVRGSGELKGLLSEVEAKGRLLVDTGSINLPGGKIKLLQDGTLDLSYRALATERKAQLVTNLKGETQLTAVKNGVTAERYDISIDMKGDLLTPNGLILTATSQPGDLTQDRILQLLGRTDLLQNVFQQGVNSSVENDLRNALTSIALPSFLGGFTNNIAKSIGFDYLSVDYNAFEQASVSFAKSLDRGFFLQGRRQILPPLPGQPVAYDIRLAYRPRRGPDALRGLSFSIGTDQFRPYKISIDLTQRVRTQKPPYRSISLDVPKK